MFAFNILTASCHVTVGITTLSLWQFKFMKVNMKVTQSCPTLCDPMDCPWNSPGQNIGVGSHSHLQGIFIFLIV